MGTKRRTEYTVETDQIILIHPARAVIPTWCSECGDLVSMVAPEDLAATGVVSSREIYRLVEAGSLHFTETAGGGLLVCLNSFPFVVRPTPGNSAASSIVSSPKSRSSTT